MEKFLELGQIVNTKGLKGEVKVNSFSEDSTRFERIKKIFLKKKNELKEYEIQKVGYSKNQVILKFKGIDTIEQAETLRNTYILVDRDSLEKLPEGVYYIADLIGLEVYTQENILIGKVEDIFSTGSNDVYVVKDEEGKEKLLPGIDEVIKQIDIENKKIIVNLIEGL
ncbi:MAG: 16S rRNA processing protein RimM [Clostridia bacterium]|jgi:16S rRNA processing protein RimM|nr:16S rRNA processing protein RimM [Clostridia bacterium]